jgi:hypothetical protein
MAKQHGDSGKRGGAASKERGSGGKAVKAVGQSPLAAGAKMITRSDPVAAASNVDVACRANTMAVQLQVSEGEKIRYEVLFRGAQATFAIVDQHGVVILSSQDAPVEPGHFLTIWPTPTTNVKIPDDLTHTFGMHFIAATTYNWIATRIAKDGSPIEPLKNCTYERSSQTDSFFDPLRVFTV